MCLFRFIKPEGIFTNRYFESRSKKIFRLDGLVLNSMVLGIEYRRNKPQNLNLIVIFMISSLYRRRCSLLYKNMTMYHI